MNDTFSGNVDGSLNISLQEYVNWIRQVKIAISSEQTFALIIIAVMFSACSRSEDIRGCSCLDFVDLWN